MLNLNSYSQQVPIVIKQNNSMEIELYTVDCKIERVSAFALHPYKTSFWNTVFNWLWECFWGKSAVLVKVEGETSLYMRVDELSKVLNIPSKSIQKGAIDEDITHFLVSNQVKSTADKIQNLISSQGIALDEGEETLSELIRRCGYRNILQLIEHEEFNLQPMVLTLLDVGRQLAHYQPKGKIDPIKERYQSEITKDTIFIWKKEGERKTKIDLKTLKVEIHDPVKETLIAAQNLLQSQGINWDQNEERSINALITRFGFRNIMALIQHANFSKTPMILTLLHAGRQLINFQPVENENLLKERYQFEITQETAFIWKMEGERKTKIDLKTLKVEIHDPVKDTLTTVKNLLKSQGVSWDHNEEKCINELITRFGYRNILALIRHADFSTNSMTLTLLEIGRKLIRYEPKAKNNPFVQVYSFEIMEGNAFICKKEGTRKTTIDLKALKVEIHDPENDTLVAVKNLLKPQGVNWDQNEEKSINELITQFGYKNVLALIQHPEFSANSMALTLLDVGRKLIQYDPKAKINPFEQRYSFEIKQGNVFIWKVEHDQKISINLKTLKVKVHNSVHEIVSTVHLANASESIFNQAATVFKSIITPTIDKGEQLFFEAAAHFQIPKRDGSHLIAVADRVGYPNLNDALGSLGLNAEAKGVMLRTFVAIGREFVMPKFFDSFLSRYRFKYVKREKKDDKRVTSAFAINKDEIIIVQGRLGKGSYKVVSSAIKLNNLDEPLVRVKIKPKEISELSKTTELNHETCVAIREVKEEASFLEKLNHPCIVPPYTCEMTSKERNILIMFQKRLDGDGDKLLGASIYHQLSAFKDVASGLAYLHGLGYAHMDMKPANFLIEGNVNTRKLVRSKVADFGMTGKIGDDVKGGSLFYLPPEVISQSYFGIQFKRDSVIHDKIDSFSLGVTIFELVIGGRPNYVFGLLSQSEIHTKIEQAKETLPLGPENATKKAVLNVALTLLQRDPKMRITCTEAERRLGVIKIPELG